MAASNFVKYDAPGLEPKIANEAEKIQALQDLVNRIQQKNVTPNLTRTPR